MLPDIAMFNETFLEKKKKQSKLMDTKLMLRTEKKKREEDCYS